MWSVIYENKDEKIASLNISDVSDLASRVSSIFSSGARVPYSGVVVPQRKSFSDGEAIEKSCYEKGGLSFLYKSYDPSVENVNVPNSLVVPALTRIAQSYIGEAFGSSGLCAELEVAWAVCQREGDYGTIHNHVPPGTLPYERFSGMLYLSSPKCISPETFPNGCLHIIADDKVFYCPPVPGSVVVWPSRMLHGIHPFRGDGNRVGIAFDFWKRKAK